MRKLLLLTLIPLALFAEAFLISNIPLPKTYVMNLDPYKCDEECLQKYLEHGEVFSFLAHAEDIPLNSETLQEAKNIYISVFNLGSAIVTNNLKIAMLLPYKKIGKYATTTTNAAFAYLMSRNVAFTLKSFTIDNESKESIAQALQKIEQEGFHYIIAPLTLEGAKNLLFLDPEESSIYFPTIHKNDLNTSLPNLYFGAIDYKAQSKALLKEASSPLVIFYDRSSIGEKLQRMQEELYLSFDENMDELILHPDEQTNKRVIKFPIASRTTNLEHELKDNDTLEGASVMLDTPLVKSGMIMSQLTLYDINVTNILSTQINYDPLILSITQYEDRKNMIIANSITEKRNVLIESNALLGNDIRYDWINYSTTIGLDFFFHFITNLPREYDIPMLENQVLYPVELIEPSYSRFVKYYSTSQEENLLY